MKKRSVRRPLSRSGKQLVVRFHTSSIEKFLQARILFQRNGYSLRYFRESQEPYREEYALGQEVLLEKALGEIRHRVGANSLFFVEDTTVRVEALSNEAESVPGLRVKEWFRSITFDELDAQLRNRGNCRTATVSSDIALYVPGLGRTVFVHGETQGDISTVAPDFETSYVFPWLTPNTFNGWFIPRGSKRVLGEMGFEESLEYDFRARSLNRLLGMIEEYTAVLNLGGHAYSVRKATGANQEWLFPQQSPLVLVIGRVCAGKSTFGQYLAKRHQWLHIEASDEMSLLAREAGVGREESSFGKARRLLRDQGPDIVAKSIAAKYHDRLESGVVITGFRAIEEVMFYRNLFPTCVVVYINAGDRLRFWRHLERGRLENVKTLKDFEAHDQSQWGFGLLARARDIVDVPRDVADVELNNEFELQGYYEQVDALVDGLSVAEGGTEARLDLSGVAGATRSSGELVRGRRVFRCLGTLARFEHGVSCVEIAREVAAREGGKVINVRHVNWVLSRLPQLVSRSSDGSGWRYEIRPAGRAYIEAVRVRGSGRGVGSR